MRIVRTTLASLALVFVVGWVGWSQSATTPTPPVVVATPKDAAQILKVAAEVNGLESEKLAPWHLKSTFQLYDANGKPSEQGTYEEFWASLHKYKRIYTSPSFTQTEWATEDGKYYRTGRLYVPPIVLSLVRSQMISPMPSEQEISDAVLTRQVQGSGKGKLVCVSLTRTIQNVPSAQPGLFSTYCFNEDRPILRTSMLYGGVQSIANEMVLFQNRYLPKVVRVNGYDKPLLDIRILLLKGIASSPGSEFQPPANAMQVRYKPRIVGKKGVTEVHILHNVTPVYPYEAKQHRVEGLVLIKAVLGTDGRLGNLALISAPDPSLAEAAASSAMQWEFSPYLVDGQPVELVFTIQVSFRIGS